MFYVYLLRNRRSGRIYIGYSSDLRRRMKEHGENWELLYYEAYQEKRIAQKREKQLKKYGGSLRALKRRLNL